jgi:hypothetical protein
LVLSFLLLDDHFLANRWQNPSVVNCTTPFPKHPYLVSLLDCDVEPLPRCRDVFKAVSTMKKYTVDLKDFWVHHSIELLCGFDGIRRNSELPTNFSSFLNLDSSLRMVAESAKKNEWLTCSPTLMDCRQNLDWHGRGWLWPLTSMRNEDHDGHLQWVAGVTYLSRCRIQWHCS